tara:strand:+ start:424 stop:660 length:237 start_codon:yes stop_codon:yes gene_type:complete
MIDSDWLTARETAAYLRVSERQLLRWRKTGILETGVHYRRKFPSPKSALLYQIKLCEKAMCDASSRDYRTLEMAESKS